jgi:Uma2 family endonuclease
MISTTVISVEEYLQTSYDGADREYVDGRIVERNVGEFDHSDLQTSIAAYLRQHYKQFWSGVELRVQVKRTRFRVPDVCVAQDPRPERGILTSPPFLVVEVLSKDDRVDDLQEKIDDYLACGVKYIWVVNPRTRRGYLHTSEGSHEAKDGVLRTKDPEIAVPLSEVLSPQ